MYIVEMNVSSCDNPTGTLVGYVENKQDANLLAGRHFAAYWLRDFFCWEHCCPDDMDKFREGVSMLIPEDRPEHKAFLDRIHGILCGDRDGFDSVINGFCQEYCNLVAQLFNNDRVLTGDGNKEPGRQFYTITKYVPPEPVPRAVLRTPIEFLSRYEKGYQFVGVRALKQAVGNE